MTEQPVNPDLTSDDKLWAALANLPIIGWVIGIVILLMEDKKSRPFMKHNAIQGLALTVIATVLSFVCIGFLIYIYMLYLAYEAYQGKYSQIPLITDFIKNQGWA